MSQVQLTCFLTAEADSRLLALSHLEAELTTPLWERTLEIDTEIERRAAERETKRRETKLGAPAPV